VGKAGATRAQAAVNAQLGIQVQTVARCAWSLLLPCSPCLHGWLFLLVQPQKRPCSNRKRKTGSEPASHVAADGTDLNWLVCLPCCAVVCML
jgi:hypothetical protein